MRILWITNVPIYRRDKQIYGGGWLNGAYNQAVLAHSIFVAFPDKENSDNEDSYSFKTKVNTLVPAASVKRRLVEIIEKVNPDIIHIWGTEYVHSFSAISAAKECGLIKKTVVSIQGLTSVYSLFYYAEVPIWARMGLSINEIRRGTSLTIQKLKFYLRGKYEVTTLREATWCIGRTDWDEAYCKKYNNSIGYRKCNEILRDSFYTSEKWDYERCVSNSIFFSQAHYPIKGLHRLLLVLSGIVKKYPQTKVFVAGRKKDLVSRIKSDSYEKYLQSICHKYCLTDRIVFVGIKDENEMAKQYRQANVFVSSSSIENSPNSLGEAMIIGVPVVSSDVGGVKNLLTHGSEGFIYPWEDNYMLAYYIEKIFSMTKEELKNISQNEIKKAEQTHSIETNSIILNEIYNEIVSNG